MLSAAWGTGCATRPPPPHAKAIHFQAEGARAYASGDLDRAAGLFALALDYSPKMPEARNGLGLVALARGDEASAEQQFRAALALNEELAEAHLNLGFIELVVGSWRRPWIIPPGAGHRSRLRQRPAGGGRDPAAPGQLEDARWELAKLCELEPQNPSAHASHALVLARMDRIAAAEQSVQKAIALDATSPPARRARAEILKRGRHAGRRQEMRAVVRRAHVGGQPGAAGDDAGGRRHADEADRELRGLEQAAPRRAEVAFLRAFVCLKRNQLPRRSSPPGGPCVCDGLIPGRAWCWPRRCFARPAGRGSARDRAFPAEAPPGMARERREAEWFLNR